MLKQHNSVGVSLPIVMLCIILVVYYKWSGCYSIVLAISNTYGIVPP